MAILEKPVINFFKSSAKEVMANESICLEWDVAYARKVKLDVLDVDVVGNTNYIIEYDRQFELTAYSRLNKKVTQIISVILYKPSIVFFVTEAANITEGKPIEIRFKIRHALRWKIVAEYKSFNEILAEGDTNNDNDYLSEHAIKSVVKGACTLRLTTNNGPIKEGVDIAKLYIRPLSLQLFTDEPIVKSGSSVRLHWSAINAHKLILNPGNFNVTIQNHFYYEVNGQQNIEIELMAEGDYGQILKETKTIVIATVNELKPDNNNDRTNPEFYLKWTTTGLENMRLMPDNITVRSNEIKQRIDSSPRPVTKTLVGFTKKGEEVSRAILLEPCRVRYFVLKKGKAILGAMATVQWKAMHVKKLFMLFPDEQGQEELDPHQTSYNFQVSKTRERIRLIAWGAVNIVENEIAIPAFESPAIKSFTMPAISLIMGFTWKTAPITANKNQVFQHLNLLKDNRLKTSRFINSTLKFLAKPSTTLLSYQQKSKSNLPPYSFQKKTPNLLTKVYLALKKYIHFSKKNKTTI